jgi:hypothetical protein
VYLDILRPAVFHPVVYNYGCYFDLCSSVSLDFAGSDRSTDPSSVIALLIQTYRLRVRSSFNARTRREYLVAQSLSARSLFQIAKSIQISAWAELSAIVNLESIASQSDRNAPESNCRNKLY